MGRLPDAGGVASPCTSVCTMDEATGFCIGCFRTLDEIAMWSVLGDEDKRAVWSALTLRRAAHPALQGDAAAGRSSDGDR